MYWPSGSTLCLELYGVREVLQKTVEFIRDLSDSVNIIDALKRSRRRRRRLAIFRTSYLMTVGAGG
jgi:hypothetical protein